MTIRKLDVPEWGFTLIEKKLPLWLIVVHSVTTDGTTLTVFTTMSVVPAENAEVVKEATRKDANEEDLIYVYSLMSIIDQARMFEKLGRELEDIDTE